MSFEPIAIVGRACVLPGVLSPAELFRAVVEGRDLLGPAPDDRWGVAKERILTSDPSRSDDACWSDRGGYVRDFERVFDPNGFQLPAAEIRALDPLFQWVLHTAREALRDAKWQGDLARVGAIFGNLSFPSSSMSRYAERVWLGDAADTVGLAAVDPRNRFMSGLPAHVLASALGLGAGAYALDAACASSLYAIKLACDALHDRRADTMLAGAVNRADDLFIHVGFCALSALSKRGKSTPFDASADGLVPGEGAGFLVLKRLGDALRDGDVIHGVIRGVGLSNDGRGRGMLAPAEEGQVRAMRSAYAQAGLDPSSVQYVECHATGTPVGDATEIRSLSAVFGADRAMPIGSLKANMGHLITAAGVSGLIKVLEAMREGLVPPTPNVQELNPTVAASGFRPVSSPVAWPATGVRRAGVSAFGFGGNNAHLVVETLDPAMPYALPAPVAPVELAIVSVGARVADGASTEDFAQLLASGESRIRARGDRVSAHADEVAVSLSGLKFPPNDLAQSLAQQTSILAAARDAVDGLSLPAERTTILIGSQCDPEVARYGARWRAAEWAHAQGLDAAWLSAAREAFVPVLKSPGVLGTMPNIPANRLNSQFDLSGPSFTVASEELSGIRALEIASRWLASHEIDAAVVGAVDVASEPVHEAASLALLGEGRRIAGDAAVVLVLKRLDDAKRDGDPILAVITGPDDSRPYLPLGVTHDQSTLGPLVGSAHAATGLVHVLAAALAMSGRTLHGADRHDRARVFVEALHGQRSLVCLRAEAGATAPRTTVPSAGPALRFPAHPKTPHVPPIPARSRSAMTQTMAPAPVLPPTTHDVLHVTVAAPVSVASAPVAVMPPTFAPPSPALEDSVFARFAAYQRELAALHHDFLAQQSAVHQRFLALQQNALVGLAATATQGMTFAPAAPGYAAPATPAYVAPAAPAYAAPSAPAYVAPAAPAAPVIASPAAAPAPTTSSANGTKSNGATSHPAPAFAPSAPAAPVKSAAPAPSAAPSANGAATKPKVGPRELPISTKPVTGPSWDRAQLEIHAGGKISEIFGPLFEQQDRHAVQVRMPEPPLLLADRVTGIDAVPGSMGKGTVWTETDVRKDSWWLNEGYMPAGIMIESGQADLFLISYLGIDFLNQGERAYRLLGCELTYHGNLPTIGETLRYDIHVDGHANHGDVRIFFFHYDCHVSRADGEAVARAFGRADGEAVARAFDGRRGLSVREGQAGFFTKAELADSAGILWKPEEQEVVQGARVDAPQVPAVKSSFTRTELEAFADGDVLACFGPGYEFGETHNRTPRIQGGRMLFHDAITNLDPKGGPWKRGYMRSVQKISPTDWFFDGHFKNDPCMPGTLMFEGCLQMMSFYIAAMGYTLKRDGWRFQPIPEEKYQLLCRGQVIPTSTELVYEIFVEEVHDGPVPKLYADLLCTVDGRKAFHARRMGLELVPDWPLTSWTELLEGYEEPKPVAEKDGFKFGYDSLLACAWAKPSLAFGKMYEVFDGTRRVARLPGPPYHFMSRVSRIDGPIGVCKPGAEIEIEYDVPPGEWYFHENGYPTMPFCVFLEAALQPCGWLASFVGSALTVDEDLSFRNLDGSAKFLAEVFPTSGTFRTVVKITNISQSAGMIIESFDVRCYVGDTPVYELKTVFGFFPLAALENQVGLPISDTERAMLNAPSDFRVDLTTRPAKYCEGSARLANPMLLMLDRVTAFEPKGGKKGLGFLRGEKDVDVAEWFFKAHFFQDPVQPGSLGIEQMIQLLQFFMLETGMADGLQNPRFEPILVERPHAWKYRGQVVPKNKLISSTLEVVEVGRDERGAYAISDASLWVDGKRIYEAKGLGMRLVSGPMGGPDPKSLAPYTVTGGAPSKKAGDRSSESSSGAKANALVGAGVRASAPAEDVLDPSRDTWLGDHRPTWTVPALPMMSMVDRLAASLGVVAGTERATLRDVQLQRWLPIDRATRIRTEVREDAGVLEGRFLAFREARDPKLSRFEPVAIGKLSVEPLTAPEALSPLENGTEVADPYAEGTLFHGPAFRYLARLVMGSNGSTATLDAARGSVPSGATSQGLLDALTHGIPHDRLHLFSSRIAKDLVAYPYRIPFLRFHSDAPTSGEVVVETRFEGFDGNERFPAFRLVATANGRPWVELRLVEILLAKGPIGSASPRDRLAFLRDRTFVSGLGLSRLSPSETRLRESDVKTSDWLPGTVAGAYDASGDLVREVAVKDHVAQRLLVHPRLVAPCEDGAHLRTEPLTKLPLAITREGDDVVVRDAGVPVLDVEPVRAFWSRWFGIGRWPVEDVFYGLIERFVGRVHVEDPDALAALRGKPVLFLGNHQIGIESLLFSIVASSLVETPTLTLAKVEHQETWLGKLIQHCFRYPEVRDPGVIAYFDRQDPESLPRIVKTLGAGIAGEAKSLMVHVEGTRSLECRSPVTKMSGVFVDLAIQANVPVVPVRFARGLPVEPLAERLEFPLGMGRQDYYLGAPIAPATLAKLPYKERIERVTSAINALGPSHAVEQPTRPDPVFEKQVHDRMARTGASIGHATIFEVLATLASPGDEVRTIVEGERRGEIVLPNGPKATWLAELARTLAGPRGANVRIG